MVTKTEIARAANVSRTCVSQVLNKAPNARIPERTRRHVQRIAMQLGYRTPVGRPAPTPRTTITYLYFVEDDPTRLTEPWRAQVIWQMLWQLQQLAAADGRDLTLLAAALEQPAFDWRGVLEARPPAGVIVDGRVPSQALDMLEALGCRYVLTGALMRPPTAHAHASADGDGDAPPLPAVFYDIDECVLRLVRYLQAQGARRIALITPPLERDFERLVLRGYRRAMATLGLAFDPALVRGRAGREAVASLRELDSLHVAYDGVLCGQIDIATRVTQFLTRDATAPAGPDLPVAAIGTAECAQDLPHVAICGVSFAELARASYRLLLDRINFPARRHQRAQVALHMYQPAGAVAS